MIHYIEPIKRVVLDDVAYEVEIVNEKIFGGFCDCGGSMFQKLWLKIENLRILLSECDKCWKNIAYFFNSTKFVKKEDAKVVEKSNFIDYLKNYLSDLEIQAMLEKAKGKPYKPVDLSRAKKKLTEMNFPFEEVLEILK